MGDPKQIKANVFTKIGNSFIEMTNGTGEFLEHYTEFVTNMSAALAAAYSKNPDKFKKYAEALTNDSFDKLRFCIIKQHKQFLALGKLMHYYADMIKKGELV